MAARIYLQIKEMILEEIRNKPVNSSIRSERELASACKASRMTVRSAVNELVDEGILYRDKNRGTFVADRKLVKKNTSAESLEKKTESDYRIIYFSVKDAEPDIAPHLGITTDDSVLRIVRINEKEGRPQSAEEIYYIRTLIPDERMGDLEKLLDLSDLIRCGSVTQRFFPMIVPVKYANLLEMKIDMPIIEVESVIMNKSGQPLVYIREFINPMEKTIEITT